METGVVRSILAQHALAGPSVPSSRAILSGPSGPPFQADTPGALAADTDPNRLIDAWPLVQALQELERRQGPAAVTAAAEAYVQLWGRTFRTLVRHLRGRPERALALFVSEVYPFLRGDRLAARLERPQPHGARVLLLADLPDSFLAGLLSGFVGLSGATAIVKPLGQGQFDVTWRTPSAHRFARQAQWVAGLRIHLVLLIVLGASLGLALAAHEAPFQPARAALIVAGAVLAQLGSNAVHDIRNAHPAGPLGPQRLTRKGLQRLAAATYLAAATCGILLAQEAPIVLLFAAAGLVAALLFTPARRFGLGPLFAGIVYGPLVVAGAYHAANPALPAFPPLALLVSHFLLSIPLGAAAASVLHLDDMADEPLDAAGGLRTLAVRQPRRRQLVTYGLLVFTAITSVAIAARSIWARSNTNTHFNGQGWLNLVTLAAGLLTLLGAAILVRTVAARSDDPARLGGARLANLLLAVATTALLIGGLP